MPVSITPLLAERLDISEERARSLLETMLQELRRRAETDGVRLPELGTFREEDGTLTFEPSPSLRRRVNHEYEGLSPESFPIPGSPDTSEAPPVVPTEDEDEPEEEAASPSEPVPATRGSGVDSFTIIALVLMVFFLGAVGWFVIDRTDVLDSSPSTNPPVASEQQPQEPSPDATPDTTTDQQPAPASDSLSKAQDDQATAAPAPKNWGIVVASRSSQASAEEVASAYRSLFDSVEVVSGTVDDRTWHRVAIGWYESETAAKRALDEHAPQLPSRAWIHKLR